MFYIRRKRKKTLIFLSKRCSERFYPNSAGDLRSDIKSLEWPLWEVCCPIERRVGWAISDWSSGSPPRPRSCLSLVDLARPRSQLRFGLDPLPKFKPSEEKSEKKLKRGSIRLSVSEHLRSLATRSAQPRHQKIWAIFHAATLPLTSKTIKLR